MSININSDTIIIAFGFFICVIIIVALLKNRIKRMKFKTDNFFLEIEAIEDISPSITSITKEKEHVEI